MKNVNSDANPTMNQRDPSKEFNQLRPTSLQSSGGELDPCCGSGIEQASAGRGLDKAIREIDKRPSRAEAYNAAATQNKIPPMTTAEGEEEAEKLGQGLTFAASSGTAPRKAFDWKATKIGPEPKNPLQQSMDRIFRR